jgi:short-subunit dehydrogenase
VAEAGFNGLMRNKRMVVPGLGNKLVTLAVRVLPRRLLLRMVDARQSRRRAAQKV